MGEDTHEIERQIKAERSDLGRNLQELEHKAKALTDWRMHYRTHTAMALGLAFGGGLVLGLVTGGGRNGSIGRYTADGVEDLGTIEREPGRFQAISLAARRSGVGQRVRQRLDETWPSIVDALVGVGAAKAVDLIARYVPGFREQLNRLTAKRSSE